LDSPRLQRTTAFGVLTEGFARSRDRLHK